jgi:hypothetical protein
MNDEASTDQTSMSIKLKIGVFFIPIVFAWFTLKKGYSTTARVVSFVWLVITLAALSAQAPGDDVDVVAASESPQKKTQITAMLVEITTLLGAYEGNEVGADNQYKGKYIQTTGIVGEIKKDILDDLYVTIGTGKQFEIPELQAYFHDSMNKRLGSLKKGQNLTVICKVSGLMMNVLGKSCKIVE